MKIRLLSGSLLPAACLGVILAGCGGNSAAPKRLIPTPAPRATSVPNLLVAYAQLVDPTLKGTIGEGRQLLAMLKPSADLSVLGNYCSTVGGDFANFQSAVHTGLTPAPAHTSASMAAQGFKIILAATDECGMAADAANKPEIKTAASDLKSGLYLIARADATVAPWDRTSS